jgi:serine/threonine-protein kinase
MNPSDVITRLNAALEGRYSVERELGEGGMATVFLADDLKHERKVALKVLKPELAAVVGAERFLTEIKTTANLQHPHILPLFDSGEADGFLFYVMPNVGGESLRSLLDREKQLSVDEALRIAGQVGSALDYAHRQGVIHRDVKPENVLLHDGQPLVADFGIALAVSAAGAGRLTETGLSLGTPYYMSPEQASADRDPGPQSDVYSLACMLYEMLVGDPPHTGSTVQAVLAKILTERPRRVTELRETVPPHVGAAVARALERLPADRFDSMEGFTRALGDPGFRHSTMLSGVKSAGASTRGSEWKKALGRILPWSVAGAAVAVAVWAPGRAEQAAGPVTRMHFTMPAGQEFWEQEDLRMSFTAMALSPDGSTLLYLGRSPDDRNRQVIWRRPFDALEATPIPGTEGALLPKFSRDGSRIAFRVPGEAMFRLQGEGHELRVMDADGGGAVVLSRGGWEFAWGDEGAIYFIEGRVLYRWWPGAAQAEQIVEVNTPDDGTPSLRDVLPGSSAALTSTSSGMYAIDFETGSATELGPGRRPQYLPSGHIVFMRLGDQVLLVQPFDPRSLSTTGPAIATSAVVDGSQLGAEYAVSPDGTLIYADPGAGEGDEVVWVDRSGGIEPIEWIDPARTDGISLSPSGDSLLIGWGGGAQDDTQGLDFWLFDLEGRSRFALTRDGSSLRPRWHPSGRYFSYVNERTRLMSLLVDGSGSPEHIVDLRGVAPPDVRWTVDGRELLVRQAGVSARSIFRFVPGESSAPDPWLDQEFNERSPAPSPDGAWLVYSSDQSGRDEVYAQPYPEGGRVFPVSIEGGRSAVWSRDGTEIFWQGDDDWLWGARVTYNAETFSVTSRERLFELDGLTFGREIPSWDVAPDGRFLFSRPVDTGRQSGIVLVRNWVQEVTGGG